MGGKAGLLLIGLLVGTSAAAQQVVTSPNPEAVSVTVYRDRNGGEMNLRWLQGYALITETRTVSLPAGESLIRFEGVAGNILPVSAIIRGLPGGTGEKNHDARLLSAGALVDASLGRQVHIRRTNPATGRVTETEAIIRSGPAGVVLQTPQGIETLRCSGLPETLIYNEPPPGLSARPTLAVTTSSASPATATLQLSYLATQFDWRANYVASIAPDGRSLDLFAWLTLANANDESFVDAGAQVVAGLPNRERNRDDAGARLVSPQISLDCWPAGTTSDIPYQVLPPPGAMEDYEMGGGEDIVVTGSRVSRAALVAAAPVAAVTAELEGLGDLKLYRIPVPVTVAANAQKQVALLHRERVRFERLYAANLYAGDDDDPEQARILLRTKNVEARGLGRPLPSGTVALFEQADGRPMLVGEDEIYDTPVGQDLEIVVGESPDIAIVQREIEEEEGNNENEDEPERYEIEISNATPRIAPVEVRLSVRDDQELIRPSRKLGRKSGQPLWRARVPANATIKLAFTVRPKPVREQDDD
jgi:hypothetical protein